jgi:hypothetical protein
MEENLVDAPGYLLENAEDVENGDRNTMRV